MTPKAIMNWSGGKDSALSLDHVLQQKEYDVQYLLTSVNDSSLKPIEFQLGKTLKKLINSKTRQEML